MKHLFITLIAAVFTFGVMVPDAEARRFGGGSSFGMQRQAAPPQAPRQAASTPARQAPAAAAPSRSWLGPIAGLAAGIGLVALLSHLGLGEGFASFVMLALLAFAGIMLFRMLTRRSSAGSNASAQSMQYAGNAPGAFGAPASMSEVGGGATAPNAAGNDLRSELDEASFMRQAKLNFIRLQTANDEGNLDDIREFTTPEVFAEIRMQHSDFPPAAGQRTDVLDLDGEVLEVAEEDGRYIVSVRFNGLIREESGAAPIAFDEIWHLVKDKSGSRGWLIAGIQQAH